MPTYIIRLASPSEANALTDLMRRSKAHWGYSPEFMHAAYPDLTLTADNITGGVVYVLEIAAGLVGFYYLIPTDNPSELFLSDLFIDPPYIGQGYGKYLWDHSVRQARDRGCSSLVFDADPNAAGFYIRMGAVQVGATESTIVSGRMLPQMRYMIP